MSPEEWVDFGSWLLKTHSPKNAKELLAYARRFSCILEKPSLASQLHMLNKAVRRVAMASLSNLSKYLGRYEQWKQTMKNHGLKWENTNGLEVFLSILDSNVGQTEIWLTQATEKLPKDYGTILVFTALTGLRPSEACLSCKLATELEQKNTLEQYFNKDLTMLQHFRFPQLFLRKSKNAYVSFVSPELLQLVLDAKPKIKYSALDTKIGRLGFKVQTAQLRKLHATTLRNCGVPQEIIDLLHGRISQSIFTRFYYKPFLQDVRDKALKGTEPLQQKLMEILKRK